MRIGAFAKKELSDIDIRRHDHYIGSLMLYESLALFFTKSLIDTFNAGKEAFGNNPSMKLKLTELEVENKKMISMFMQEISEICKKGVNDD